jgi:hypothetical protein
MVPKTGIEPVRPYEREILSLLCLPISPLGQRKNQLLKNEYLIIQHLYILSRASRIYTTISPIEFDNTYQKDKGRNRYVSDVWLLLPNHIRLVFSSE